MIALELLSIVACLAHGELALQDEPSAALVAAREILAPVAEHMDGVRHMRGRFVQTQESLLLDEPIVSRGRLLLRSDPGTVVLEIEGERPVRVRSDVKSHLVHHILSRRAECWLFERNEIATALLACFGADLPALEKIFWVSECEDVSEESTAGDEAQRPRVLVRLVPRAERLMKVMVELELVIDRRLRVVSEVRYENADGESVRLEVSEIELDPAEWERPELDFDAPLPEGVDLRTRKVAFPARDESGR